MTKKINKKANRELEAKKAEAYNLSRDINRLQMHANELAKSLARINTEIAQLEIK